jgi:D-3-phosphoglycerate dehydrogenase
MAASSVSIFLTHSPAARHTWYGERALAALRESGHVVLNSLDRTMTSEELIAAAQDCALIVADREAAGGAEVFAGLPNLVAYIRGQVDIRAVNVEAASAAGVLVTQASRGFMAAVAEWILGAMIMAARHSLPYAESYRRGEEPGFIVGRQLSGATIGVIGFGAIAEHLCGIAHAIGMRVLVFDPYQTVPAKFESVELGELLEQADFVVPLAVATDETENLIDARAFSAMRQTAWLVNASRGNLVDEKALVQALDARQIAGAALDVGRAQDQRPPLHIARRNDVIASPHIAGLTPEALDHQALETVRQAEAIIRGEVPRGAINANKATRLARLRR